MGRCTDDGVERGPVWLARAQTMEENTISDTPVSDISRYFSSLPGEEVRYSALSHVFVHFDIGAIPRDLAPSRATAVRAC